MEYNEKILNKGIMSFSLLEDTGFGFLVIVTRKVSYRIELEVYEITARDINKQIAELELYLECIISDDNDCEFHFGKYENGKQDGIISMDGVDIHIRLMKELYEKAIKLMGETPEED